MIAKAGRKRQDDGGNFSERRCVPFGAAGTFPQWACSRSRVWRGAPLSGAAAIHMRGGVPASGAKSAGRKRSLAGILKDRTFRNCGETGPGLIQTCLLPLWPLSAPICSEPCPGFPLPPASRATDVRGRAHMYPFFQEACGFPPVLILQMCSIRSSYGSP